MPQFKVFSAKIDLDLGSVEGAVSSLTRLERSTKNTTKTLNAELDKARSGLSRLGDKSSETFQRLQREVRESANSLPEITKAAKSVESELDKSINKDINSIRELEKASGISARGIKQRFTDVSSGLNLAFGEGGSLTVGLRRAFFGLNDSSNILAKGLDRLSRSHGTVEIASDKVSQQTFKTIQSMTRFSQAIEQQTSQLKQLGKQEGVSPRLANELETQYNRIIKAQKDLEVEFKKTGRVSEGTFVRAQEEIEQAGTAIDLLRAKAGTLPPVFEREFNKLASRTNIFTNGLKELDVQRKRLDATFAEGANKTTKLANATDQASTAANKADKEFKQVEQSVSRVSESAAKAASVLPTLFAAAAGGGIGAAVGGLAAGVDLGGVLDLFGQVSNAARKVAASVGAPIEQVEHFGAVVKRVYGDNFGQSAAQVGEAVQEAQLRMQRFGEVSEESLVQATESLFRLSDTYQVDFKETIDAAGTLVQEFGIGFDEAFDFISTGFQKGLNSNNDFLDSIREYSVQFSAGGADASQFFNLLDSGLQGGVLGTDKAADAFKEFRVRIQDGSILTANSLNQIGINSEDLLKKMASGQVTAAQAFEFILQKLRETDDQNIRMQAGVGLLGTQYEDLGKTALGLTTVGTTLEDMAGATEKLDIQYTGLSSQLEQFKRNVLLAFDPQPVLGLFSIILSTLQPIFISIFQLFSQFSLSITNFISTIQGTINEVVNGTGVIEGTFATAIASVVALIQGDWDTAWQAAVAAVGNMADSSAEILINLVDSGYEWGYGFMSQLGDGIIAAGQAVLDAVIDIANSIASFLAPGSPPEKGPLSTIDEWGEGLTSTFQEGFQASDLDFLADLLTPVQKALKDVFTDVKEGEKNPALGVFSDIKNELDDVIAAAERTGEVNEAVFDRIAKATRDAGLAESLKKQVKDRAKLQQLDEKIAAARASGFVPAELLLEKKAFEDKLKLQKQQAQAANRLGRLEENLANNVESRTAQAAAPALAAANALREQAQTARETYEAEIALLDQRLDAGIISEEEYLTARIRAEQNWFAEAENTDKEATAARIREYQIRLEELKAAKKEELRLERETSNESIREAQRRSQLGSAIFDPENIIDREAIVSTVGDVAEEAGTRLVTGLGDRLRTGSNNIFTGLRDAVSNAFSRIRDFITRLPPEAVFPISVLVGIFSAPIVFPIINSIDLIIPAIKGLIGLILRLGPVIRVVTGAILRWSIAGLIVIGLIQNWDLVLEVWKETLAVLGGAIVALIGNIVGFISALQESSRFQQVVENFAKAFSLLGNAATNVGILFTVLLKKVFKVLVLDAMAGAIILVNSFISEFGGIEALVDAAIPALLELSNAFLVIAEGINGFIHFIVEGDFQKAFEFLQAIPESLNKAFSDGAIVSFTESLLDTLARLLPFLEGFVDFIRPWIPTILAVVGSIAALAAIIIPLIPIITSVIGFLAALNPVVLGIAAVIAIVAAAFVFWDEIVAAFNATLAFLQPVIAIVQDVFSNLVVAFQGFAVDSGLITQLFELFNQLKLLFIELGPILLNNVILSFRILGGILLFVGGILLNIVVTAVQTFLDILPFIGGVLAGLVQILSGVVEAFRGVIQIIKGVVAVFTGDFAGGLNQIITGIGTFQSGAISIFTGLLTAVVNAGAGILAAIASFIGNFFNNIGLVFDGTSIQFFETIAGLADGLANLVPQVVGIMQNLSDQLTTIVQAAGPAIVEAFLSWILDVIQAVQDLYTELVGASIVPVLITEIIEWFAGLPAAILGGLTGGFATLVASFIALGVDLVSGLIGSITEGLPQLATLIGNALPNIGDLLASVFGGGETGAPVEGGGIGQPIDPAVFATSITSMQSLFTTFITMMQTGITGIGTLWTTTLTTIQTVWMTLLLTKTTGLQTFFITVQTFLVNWQTAWFTFNQIKVQVFTQTIATITSILSAFHEFVLAVLQEIIEVVYQLVAAWMQVGVEAERAGKSISGGMKDAQEAVKKTIPVLQELEKAFNRIEAAANRAANAVSRLRRGASEAGVGSAQGGDWRTRQGLYILHEDEMVLPKPIADAMRTTLLEMQRHGIGSQAFSGINPTTALSSNLSNVSTAISGGRDVRLELTQVINNGIDQEVARRQTIQWIQEAMSGR